LSMALTHWIDSSLAARPRNLRNSFRGKIATARSGEVDCNSGKLRTVSDSELGVDERIIEESLWLPLGSGDKPGDLVTYRSRSPLPAGELCPIVIAGIDVIKRGWL